MQIYYVLCVWKVERNAVYNTVRIKRCAIYISEIHLVFRLFLQTHIVFEFPLRMGYVEDVYVELLV